MSWSYRERCDQIGVIYHSLYGYIYIIFLTSPRASSAISMVALSHAASLFVHLTMHSESSPFKMIDQLFVASMSLDVLSGSYWASPRRNVSKQKFAVLMEWLSSIRPTTCIISSRWVYHITCQHHLYMRVKVIVIVIALQRWTMIHQFSTRRQVEPV
jgi:hypothetical protein